eukprot:jgi/Picsp_1/1006/NSC_04490-R1_cation exchanger-like protein
MRMEEEDAPNSEILNFQFLLKSCEDIAAGNSRGRDDLRNWQSSYAFHHYMETLEQRFRDLKHQNKIGYEDVERYEARIDSLSDAMEPVSEPKVCSSLERALRSNNSSTLSTPIGRPVLPLGMKTAQHVGQTSACVAKKGMPVAMKFEPVSISEAAKARLQSQAQVQESLTDELADMAAALKMNTKAVESKVQEREQLLETTEKALDTSLQGTKSSVASVVAARRSSRMNLCFTLMILLLIGVGFAAMYIFIRVTSFTGYRAQTRTTEL